MTNNTYTQSSTGAVASQVGQGKNIRWDTRRHCMTMTPHRDSLAAQAHEASRNGLGSIRSHELRAWYTLQAEQDERFFAMLAYFDSLDADLEALALMSHSDVLAETEEQIIDPHSGAPPGGEREIRPHHVATMICAARRTKEAGHVARLHTDTII